MLLRCSVCLLNGTNHCVFKTWKYQVQFTSPLGDELSSNRVDFVFYAFLNKVQKSFFTRFFPLFVLTAQVLVNQKIAKLL